MFKVGDVCQLVPSYSIYDYVLILEVSSTNYRFTTSLGTTEGCHIRSIMAGNFHLIASNMSSIDEARQLYPEYFI